MRFSNRKATLELLLIAAVAIVFAIVELYIDTVERFVVWAAENESLLITEVVTLAIVLALGLSVYSFRRWREAVALESDRARLQKTVTVEQDANMLMRSYADAVTQGQEAERFRLARELHDDTIQRLILLNQKTALSAFDHADSDAADDLQEMQDMIDKTISHVRLFINELRPTYLTDLGLVPALSNLIKQTRERNNDLLVEFDAIGEPCRLSESMELALYRIVQSALSNVEQHAGATIAKVVLDFRPKTIHLTITDDGHGFTTGNEVKLATEGHYGLIGMRERADLIDAQYQITSSHGNGTQIQLSCLYNA